MTSPEIPPGGGDDSGRGLSGVQRAGIVLGALGVLLIVFVILQGGDDSGSSSSSSAPQTTATQTTAPTTATTTAATTTDDSGTTTADTTTGETTTGSTTEDGGSETGTTQTTPSPPAIPTVRVVNGRPQGGVERLEFTRGERVRFKVRSDVADEVHVHGYDVSKNVAAGGSVTFSFPATIEGRFEVELEAAHTQIAELEVEPS
jgi:cytoskeletal protein RodZ